MAGITIRDIGILFGYEVDKASEDKVENSVKELKNMASKALGAIGLTLSIAGISSAIKDCVSLASEVQEMENKFDVVFDNLRDDVDAWCQDYADAIGRNKNDIKTYLADQQNLLVGFGMTREAGAELSKQMTTLALDLASFANMDEDSAVNNMTKAVMGESEAARALGAVLNDNTRAQAMQTLGLSGTYEKLDQLTKMQVNYQAILGQSPDAIGDCERSLGSYESTMRQFQARLKEVKQIIGQFFLPTFQKVLSFGGRGLTLLRDGVQRFSAFAEQVGGAERILRILGITAAAIFGVMNFGKIISGLTAVVKLLTSAKAAMVVAAAAALVLALIVEDFIAFMQGKDSLIGSILSKTGVDCDALRERIRNAWDTIRNVFETTASTIRNTVGGLFSAIRQFWEQNGESITQGVSRAVTSTVGKLEQFSKWLSENWGLVVKVAEAVAKLVGVFLVTKGATEKIVGTIKKVNDVVGKAKTVLGPAAEAFRNAGGGIKGFGAAFKALVSPVGVAIIAIAAIAAVLYDLFNFMNGKDSVFGTVLGKLGVDTEAVRAKMIAAWGQVKTFLLSAWNVTKSVATDIFGGLQTFWANHGEQIKGALVNTWTIIKNLLTAAWNIIKTVAMVIFGALKVFWDTWGSTIISFFSGVWETIKSVFSTVLNVLTDLFAVFASLFAGDWSGLWQNVKQLLSDVWNGILSIVSSVLSAVWSVVSSIFSSIWSFISGIAQDIWTAITTTFSNILTSIVETVTGIKDSIVNGFQSAIDWITSLPSQALQWGADIINGIIDGIRGAIDGIGDAVSGVASTIRSFLHFSEPDEGPLSDFSSYMPDMMSQMAQGIQNGTPAVQAAVMALATAINAVLSELPEGSAQYAVAFVQAFVDALSNAGTQIQVALASSLSSTGELPVIDPATVSQTMEQIVSAIQSALTSVLSNTTGSGSQIQSYVQSLLTGLVSLITSAIAELSTSVSGFHSEIGTGISSSGASALQNVSSVVRAIASTIQSVMTALPPQALQWGVDIGEAIATGLSASLGRVKSEVANLASTIHSYVGFSEPENGPLSDFHTYMPDMIDLMTRGIRAGRSKVRKAIGSLADDMSVSVQSSGAHKKGRKEQPKPDTDRKPDSHNTPGSIFSALKEFAGYAGSIAKSAGRMIASNKDSIRSTASSLTNNMSALSRSATPSPSTVRTATTNNSTSNRTINFKSEIKQEFNGDMAAQQNISKAAGSAADDTTGALARALSYA